MHILIVQCRGWNNSWSSDMTSQILHFVRPEFSVIIQMAGHFFLEELGEFVRNTLKALEIVRTTFKRMSHLSTDDNLTTTLCSVYIKLRSIASCLINIEYYKSNNDRLLSFVKHLNKIISICNPCRCILRRI